MGAKDTLKQDISNVFKGMNDNLFQLFKVEDPEGNPQEQKWYEKKSDGFKDNDNPKALGWYEDNDGKIKLTEDEEVQSGKSYYVPTEDIEVKEGKEYFSPFDGDKYMREGIVKSIETYVESLDLSDMELMGAVSKGTFKQSSISWKTDLSPAYDNAVEVMKECTDGMKSNPSDDAFAQCISDTSETLMTFKKNSGKFPIEFTVEGTATSGSSEVPVAGKADGAISGAFLILTEAMKALFALQALNPSSANNDDTASGIAESLSKICTTVLTVTATGKGDLTGTAGATKFKE